MLDGIPGRITKRIPGEIIEGLPGGILEKIPLGTPSWTSRNSLSDFLKLPQGFLQVFLPGFYRKFLSRSLWIFLPEFPHVLLLRFLQKTSLIFFWNYLFSLWPLQDLFFGIIPQISSRITSGNYYSFSIEFPDSIRDTFLHIRPEISHRVLPGTSSEITPEIIHSLKSLKVYLQTISKNYQMDFFFSEVSQEFF